MPGLFGGSLFGKQAPTQGLDPDQAQSLGIIQAMQQSQQAGMQRTASPMGSIAQNLLPIFAAMIYSKAAQAQSAQQAQKNQLDIQSKQADIENKRALTEKYKRPDKTAADDPYKGLPAEIRARMNPDPAVQQAVQAEEDAKDRRAQFAAGVTIQKATDVAQAVDAQKTRERLAKPFAQVPEYRRKTAVDKNTLQPAPNNFTVGDFEAPDSNYAALTDKDITSLRGAKQITQQLDRLEELIPRVLPNSRLGLPMTLANQAVSTKAGPDSAEFDRLAVFEKLKGIRDMLTGGRINQTEVQQVGQPDRYTDDQGRALAKVKAMRDLVTGGVSAMDLNPDALRAQPRTLPAPPTNAAPDTGSKPAFQGEVDVDRQVAGRMYNQLKAEHPDWGDAQLANEARKRLSSSVGAQ